MSYEIMKLAKDNGFFDGLSMYYDSEMIENLYKAAYNQGVEAARCIAFELAYSDSCAEHVSAEIEKQKLK